MIEYQDIGYVLSKQSYKGGDYNVIHVFTKEHGKVAGLVRKNYIISNFSYVEISYFLKYANGLGFFKVSNCRELWVHFLYNMSRMKMLNNMCRVLNLVLPFNANEPEIYKLTEFVYNKILLSDNILPIYQAFHIKLLELLGYGNDHKKEQIVAQINSILSTVPAVA